jgi:hypothetical protein
MYTTLCSDCGQVVSSRAKLCPHCGAPLGGGTGPAPGPGGEAGAAPAYLSKTIAQMGFPDNKLALVTDTVRSITVQDLNDLATRVSGRPIQNPKVLALKAVDLKGIEDLFVDMRARSLLTIAGAAGPGGSIEAPGGACCTCTPCCSCCAAVETNPFNE